MKNQIQDAAGSSMHNIAGGFDSDTNPEFIRFLRYAKRSCTEVQSELYVALDEKYISAIEFKDTYEQAVRTRATIYGSLTISAGMRQAKLPNNNPEYRTRLGLWFTEPQNPEP